MEKISDIKAQLTADELEQFQEFKRRIGAEAAKAQVTKLEYTLTDVLIEKGALRRACQDANRLELGAICVLPCMVKSCVSFLGSDPKASLIACISHPAGADTIDIKVAAVKRAIKDGVDEVEVTAPIAYIKDGNWAYVKKEFKKIKQAAKQRAVRVNIEASLLTDQEIFKTCQLAADCGVNMIRISSGAYAGVLSPDTIPKIKSAVKDKCLVKADGVVTLQDFNDACALGAAAIGSPRAVDLAHLILNTTV